MQFVDNVTPSYDWYEATQGVRSHVAPGSVVNDWLQMYIPNAYNTALLNYMNEYNLPVNQMLRYQEAGINPYSAMGNIQASSAQGHPGSSPSFPGKAQNQKDISNLLQGISMVTNVVGAAKDVYDYLTFGKGIRQEQLSQARYNTDIARLNQLWNTWWNTGIDYTSSEGTPADHNFPGVVESSPRARYMTSSTEEKLAHIKQLESLVDTLYPSQKAANEARAALQEYAKNVSEGRNDAVLNINTGHKKLDDFLKLLAYMLQDNAGSILKSLL